jgi:hypothetical protein
VGAIQPPKIFLESARVAQFNEANQEEARELDSNLLEEKRIGQHAEVPGGPGAILQQECCFTPTRYWGPSAREGHLHQS